MDLQSNLIESMKQKQKGGWRATFASIVVHGTLIAVIGTGSGRPGSRGM